jgi:hypothetical protein
LTGGHSGGISISIHDEQEGTLIRKTFIPGIVAGLVLAGLFGACGKGGDGGAKAAATTPIADLIKAGKPPVVVSGLFRGISPVAPTFTVSVTNASDCPVSMLQGVVLFFDEAGAVLADSKKDMGYGELSPIKPGEKIELSTMTQNEKAISGRWIIKEVVYEKPSPIKNMGSIMMKWTNPNYDAEVAAAEVKK